MSTMTLNDVRDWHREKSRNIRAGISTGSFLEHNRMADAIEAELAKQAREKVAHDLYKDGDADIPSAICDRNGRVDLGLCKRCGRAEIELEEPCVPKPEQAAGDGVTMLSLSQEMAQAYTEDFNTNRYGSAELMRGCFGPSMTALLRRIVNEYLTRPAAEQAVGLDFLRVALRDAAGELDHRPWNTRQEKGK